MNYKIIKDKKVIAGLILSVTMSAAAILLALFNSSYWVLPVALSWILLFVSLNRADSIRKIVN